MIWPGFRNFEWNQLLRLRFEEKTSRHIAVFFLVLYIIFGCVVVSGCTSSAGKEIYVTKLTYTATNYTTAKYPKGVQELEARVGYFASCLSLTTLGSTSSFACSTNETTILLSDNNSFDQSQYSNVDLFNFFMGTGKKFRIRCMDPYALIVSVILSFACIASFAFTAPENAPIMYQYAAVFSYFSFTLSLISAVWLETNITTANLIMNKMTDVYYTLKADRGMVDRGLLWTGVTLQFLSSVFLAVLGMVGKAIDETRMDLNIDEKV